MAGHGLYSLAAARVTMGLHRAWEPSLLDLRGDRDDRLGDHECPSVGHKRDKGLSRPHVRWYRGSDELGVACITLELKHAAVVLGRGQVLFRHQRAPIRAARRRVRPRPDRIGEVTITTRRHDRTDNQAWQTYGVSALNHDHTTEESV